MEDIERTIGIRLHQLRIQHRITRQKMQDLTGIERTTIYRYETGKSKIPIENLFKIVQACGEDVIIFLEQINTKL